VAPPRNILIRLVAVCLIAARTVANGRGPAHQVDGRFSPAQTLGGGSRATTRRRQLASRSAATCSTVVGNSVCRPARAPPSAEACAISKRSSGGWTAAILLDRRQVQFPLCRRRQSLYRSTQRHVLGPNATVERLGRTHALDRDTSRCRTEREFQAYQTDAAHLSAGRRHGRLRISDVEAGRSRQTAPENAS